MFGRPVAIGLLLRAQIEGFDEATKEGTITLEFALAGEAKPQFFISEEHLAFRLNEILIQKQYDGPVSGFPHRLHVGEILREFYPSD
jgi:hypothetical protein